MQRDVWRAEMQDKLAQHVGGPHVCDEAECLHISSDFLVADEVQLINVNPIDQAATSTLSRLKKGEICRILSVDRYHDSPQIS